MRDTLLDANFRREATNADGFGMRRDLLAGIESVLGKPSDTGLAASMDAFWSSWADLANNPTSGTAKGMVQQRGGQVADMLNSCATRLDKQGAAIGLRLETSVAEVNGLARQVAELSRDFRPRRSHGPAARQRAHNQAFRRGHRGSVPDLGALRHRSAGPQQPPRAGHGGAEQPGLIDGASFAGHYCGTVTMLGLGVSSAERSVTASETLAAQAETRRSSVSGVSIDEELIALTQYQQAYVAATRLVTAADEIMQSILCMVLRGSTC